MSVRSEPWPAGTPCWTDLAVDDLAVATDFYGPVMGWSFHDSGEEYGHYTLARVNGRDAAAIAPKMDPAQPTAWTVYLASDDVDSTAAAVAANGGSVLMPPMDVSQNGRMMVAVDASGAVFGVWQAGETIGAEVVNEPGALTWTDARLADPGAARSFYGAVFGYSFGDMPGAPGDYKTFDLGAGPVGGMGGMMGAPPGTPSHWLAYFSVADLEAATAAATERGGAVLGTMDTPFGRMAFLTDPAGAPFAVCTPPPG